MQFEQGFSSFFGIFDDFSKQSIPKALMNFEQSSKNGKDLAKNEENPSSTCIPPISGINFYVLIAKPLFISENQSNEYKFHYDIPAYLF